MRLRRLEKNDYQEYAVVYRNAYPGAGRTEAQVIDYFSEVEERADVNCYIAVNDQEKILGGFFFIEYTIYQNYNEIKMGGIGGVCVGLDAKKQGVAKFLVTESLKMMQDQGMPVSILYPFRHDFYQQMGWGQVGELKEFKFAPTSLPQSPERKNVRYYQEGDLVGIQKCYEIFARPQNCMVKRTEIHWENYLKNPNIFVYEVDGEIQGYMQISFEKGESFLDNNLKIMEMIYNSTEAYFGLLGFVASQLDQFGSVYYHTSYDDKFHLLLQEPRRENKPVHFLYQYSQRIGIGWMFRLVDIEKAFMSRLNYHGANVRVTFAVEDTFLPENTGTYTLILRDGKPQVERSTDEVAQIKLDISTLAQLFTNYLTVEEAMKLGLIEVSDVSVVAPLDQALTLSTPLMLEFF